MERSQISIGPICKAVGYRGVLPRTPALSRRWVRTVISTPGQAEPYLETSAANPRQPGGCPTEEMT